MPNKKHLKKNGQALLMGLIFSLVLISFASYSLYLGVGAYKKTKLQNITDAIAYTGAVSEAKVLNGIAALNEAIVFITNLVIGIALIWLFLKACAVFCLFGFGCVCLGPLKFFNRFAKPFLNKLKKLAWAMAGLQDKLMNFGRHFVILEMNKVARQNGLKYVAFYPCLPEVAAISKESTLSFLLTRANKKKDLKSAGLNDEAIKFSKGDKSLKSCYTKKWSAHEYDDAYGYYFKRGFTRNIDWAYKTDSEANLIFDKPRGKSFKQKSGSHSKVYNFHLAKTTECKNISKILTMGYKLPNPLILRDDFRERQNITALASYDAFHEAIFLEGNKSKKASFIAIAKAKPFGSSIFDMEWTARMEKVTLKGDFLGKTVCLNKDYIKMGANFSSELIYH